ncbi:hypothetical protein EVAR_94164_1 [Eumeta japonica]|uniref:Uncharacterized protein n=1 Tax=Eumeta variegata TaxID=151549 RepID=A0A4C1U869_EUMVA|nr:hypothetical protein EVAR_94164_1 [Eumeta japonica]
MSDLYAESPRHRKALGYQQGLGPFVCTGAGAYCKSLSEAVQHRHFARYPRYKNGVTRNDNRGSPDSRHLPCVLSETTRCRVYTTRRRRGGYCRFLRRRMSSRHVGAISNDCAASAVKYRRTSHVPRLRTRGHEMNCFVFYIGRSHQRRFSLSHRRLQLRLRECRSPHISLRHFGVVTRTDVKTILSGSRMESREIHLVHSQSQTCAGAHCVVLTSLGSFHGVDGEKVVYVIDINDRILREDDLCGAVEGNRRSAIETQCSRSNAANGFQFGVYIKPSTLIVITALVAAVSSPDQRGAFDMKPKVNCPSSPYLLSINPSYISISYSHP